MGGNLGVGGNIVLVEDDFALVAVGTELELELGEDSDLLDAGPGTQWQRYLGLDTDLCFVGIDWWSRC